MTPRRPLTILLHSLFLVAAALAAGCDGSASAEKSAAASSGDDCCAHEGDSKAAAAVDAARIETHIPDVVLTDQHGKTHRFYTDLVKGKLVLMNSSGVMR